MTDEEKRTIELMRRKWVIPKWVMIGLAVNSILIVVSLGSVILIPGPNTTDLNLNTVLLLFIILIKLIVYPRIFHGLYSEEARDLATLEMLRIVKMYQDLTAGTAREAHSTLIEMRKTTQEVKEAVTANGVSKDLSDRLPVVDLPYISGISPDRRHDNNSDSPP